MSNQNEAGFIRAQESDHSPSSASGDSTIQGETVFSAGEGSGGASAVTPTQVDADPSLGVTPGVASPSGSSAGIVADAGDDPVRTHPTSETEYIGGSSASASAGTGDVFTARPSGETSTSQPELGPTEGADYARTDEAAAIPASTAADYSRTDATARVAPEQTGGDTVRVPRYEEELQADVVRRDAGAVRVHKDVVEEQRTIEVPVTREEVEIRSVDPSGSTPDAAEAFQEGTVEIPVRRDSVEVHKQPVIAEELEIEKRQVRDTETVTDTVRTERIDVGAEDDVTRS